MDKNQQKFCPRCGHVVNLNEPVCPHCGFNLVKYFGSTNLPVVRHHRSLTLFKRMGRRIKPHWLTLGISVLVVIFLIVGGFWLKDRHDNRAALNQPTTAQTLAKRLPHYSWIVTHKGQEGGLNDTLVEFFNGRRSIIMGANPITLKICKQTSTNSRIRNKVNDLVKKNHNRYRITGDSLEINGHDSIRRIKKHGRYYEFEMSANNGKKMKEIMRPYKKIGPRLRN